MPDEQRGHQSDPTPVASALPELAERTPDRLSVRDELGEITLGELDALVGTVARVVLLDVRLTGRPGGARPAPDVAVRPDAGAVPTPPRRGSRLRRLPARAVAEARLRWRTRRPGPPSRDLVRFRAFGRIGERALREFRPGPPTFPVLLLHVDDTARDDWRAFVPGLECRSLPGTHLGVLRPPYVDAVAVEVRAVSREA